MEDFKIAVEQSPTLPEKLEHRVEDYMKIYDDCLNTYIKKNLDYGNSFSKLYQEFGLKSSIIRLSDKLNRIKQLEKQEQNVDDESIEDTLKDMINYATMTLIEMEDESNE